MMTEELKEIKEERTKRKREKPEDFIGWKSVDGKLEVVGTAGRTGTRNHIMLFKVTCTECYKDKELFPDGYFVISKSNLIKGAKPCGCGRSPRWNQQQFLLLARRAAKDRFIVHGFAEEFKNQNTKLNLECLKGGHKWVASISNIINNSSGCPKCRSVMSAEKYKTPEYVAFEKCESICKENNYKLIGFPSGYKNQNSRFEYECPKHGLQNVRYSSFVNNRTRCSGCAKDKGNGYFPERKSEQDFLYVLNFNNKFIKIGRSFCVSRRVKDLKSLSKIKRIHKLRTFTATHQEIYDLEQELHEELRDRGFQYYVNWSTECFQSDCLFILNKLLDNCRLEEVNK